MNQNLVENYQKVQQRIVDAQQTFQRTDEVKLLAVSKTKPIEDVLQIAKQGQLAFGENYVQEAIKKINIAPELEWHFIGPIQSNKTKAIAEHFAWVHSVDRLKIAQRLNNQRPEHLGKLQILLEVNISEEDSKAGLKVNEVKALMPELLQLSNLSIRGLMAIPQKAQTFEEQRLPFAKMRELLNELQQAYPQAQLDTLSMGMSADLEAAIAEGANIVRIGTDIFGARN